ncbi:nucleoside phosphorylase-I family protein [Flavobacterium reichenbachii]|uniref:Nucleoside phosphorylase domain-containing protein n=1 Tax=Flavobacterium reichenbachii TaxID=362418 RepID=A0A085ZNQ9_9FLAO|nr:hypothetical protein [Flavobacterium reichenbachii]KFF06073.1 hypothetical protein IW19_11290 [Flavobacterium reichenbachii]OXB14702.1 hypothetical protein B0A68_11655 [Flavobacterium reichenbachii]
MIIELQNFKDILNNNYILLITSNSIEKDAVNNIFLSKTKVKINLETKGCYIGLIESHIVVHLSGTSGITSEDSIGRLVIEFISNNEFPKPKVVLMSGFCWGNPNNTHTGQTIISNTVYSLNSDIINDKNRTFKLRLFQSKLQKEYLTDFCINGEVASLETLIANNHYRDDIINQYPSILGGEMEGFGYIPTLHSKKIPWLILKTISDLADSQFTRENQKKCAEKSANLIPLLINELDSEFEEDNNLDTDHFKNVLRGNILHIKKTDFSEESLNDFLNDNIGVILESKLKEYFFTVDQQTGDSNFVRYFCDVILEICQNSFKHGKSTDFTISFLPKDIILEDNGIDFDISKIQGIKGGSTIWKKIDTNFLKTGIARYSHQPNIYTFHLETVKISLRNLREQCSVKIVSGTIGAIQSRNQILEYNKDCTSVYLKDKFNRMTSRRLTIIEEVKSLLEKDLTVYLSVHNQSEAEEYQNALINFGDKLIILYD